MKTYSLLATTLIFCSFGSLAFASNGPCWENERARMACLKTHVLNNGSWAKAADPARAKLRDEDGYTGLHMMATYNDLSEAEALLAAGADVNAVSSIHGTPLNLAAKVTQTEMVDLLLSRGANPNARDRSAFTPLIDVLWQNNPEGEGIDLVAQNAILDSLIRYNADLDLPNEWGDYPLCISMFKTDYRRKFIAAGANLNLQVLPYGTKRVPKRLSAVSLTRPSLSCATHYTESRTSGEVAEAVADLVAAGAKVDARGPSANTPLMSAVGNNHLEAVELLLKAGANANAKNNYGQNALMIAVLRSVNPKIVEALIARTDLTETDIYHRTIKHYLAGPPRKAELGSSGKLTNLGWNWTTDDFYGRAIAQKAANSTAIKELFGRLKDSN
ncbi:MAG: ankyrin repeat domain-containing protein [Proteobacteria bacterium]|nr:MAG: ankyrin repeat domain-containing protein [Pseudomonadota bacterium]